eukprot:TRINITY_DN81979_c0_g1_i1.p1 TRINITY_DN81979_c0_g1~~TRINITY_DN81979_c0_g1_i1.p1  ORF type:complete len:324 (-),score=106.96 TRINITY_DN81979_c0_g1_i1:73-1044(-)
MPLMSEMQADMASSLEHEREINARRVKREEVHAQLVASAANEQIKAAGYACEARKARAQEHGDGVVKDAKVLLEQELERQKKEIQALRERADEAARQAAERVALAEAGLEAAKKDAADRIAKAEKANKEAIDAAEAVSADAVAIALSREAEIERTEAINIGKLWSKAHETEVREARRTEQAENRCKLLQEDAQTRAEAAKKAAAECIDKYVTEFRDWTSKAEKEWAKTQERLAADRKRALAQADDVKGLAQRFLNRSEEAELAGEEIETKAREQSLEYESNHLKWQRDELGWAAAQADGLEGLQDLAKRLREGNIKAVAQLQF